MKHTICTPNNLYTAKIELDALHRSFTIHANFYPLDFQRFFDALSVRFIFQHMRKLAHGASLTTFTYPSEYTAARVFDIVEGAFCDHVEEDVPLFG